jgi:hypothetical protein
MSHVINQSPASKNHVGDVQSTTASHAGGTNLVPGSHTRIQQLTFASRVGEFSTTSVIHVEDKKPSTTSHVGGIDYVEKPIWIGFNTKFPCNLCKGDHLNHMCPDI